MNSETHVCTPWGQEKYLICDHMFRIKHSAWHILDAKKKKKCYRVRILRKVGKKGKRDPSNSEYH